MSGALTTLVWAADRRMALTNLTVRPSKEDSDRDVLVVLFLRGGADGLNIVIPYAEDAYHRNRPTLRLAAPNDRTAGKADRALDLDGFFGLHPALAPLLSLFHSGHIALVHACGSGDQTRSHFEAMATMERGLPNEQPGPASGWLARHLMTTRNTNASPLRAVAFSHVMPDSLRGATHVTAMESLAEFRLTLPRMDGKITQEAWRSTLADLYQEGKDAVSYAGRETLAVLETLNRIDPANYRPANHAVYPDSALGNSLKQVALLIRAQVGLEIACLDRGGWDTHVAQGSAGGWLATQLEDVGRSLAAFATDLGATMNDVTVVVITVFGRRLPENSGLGTDHGRGGVMMLLGGGVRGGKVYTDWPGLEKHQLETPGDLRVTTDYRDVLAEVVTQRLHNERMTEVFPGHHPHVRRILRGRQVSR